MMKLSMRRTKYILKNIFKTKKQKLNEEEEEAIEAELIKQIRNNWILVGSGEDIDLYFIKTRIENLPLEFLRKYQNEICWRFVGSGIDNYSKIEYLPSDFIMEFGHLFDLTNNFIE